MFYWAWNLFCFSFEFLLKSRFYGHVLCNLDYWVCSFSLSCWSFYLTEKCNVIFFLLWTALSFEIYLISVENIDTLERKILAVKWHLNLYDKINWHVLFCLSPTFHKCDFPCLIINLSTYVKLTIVMVIVSQNAAYSCTEWGVTQTDWIGKSYKVKSNVYCAERNL